MAIVPNGYLTKCLNVLTFLVPLFGLLMPLHAIFDFEIASKFLNWTILIILFPLVIVVVKRRMSFAMTVAEMGTAIKAKTLEVDYSHQLLSELDIETRREVGVWLHGHVQSFNLSMARRMRALGSHVACELADEIDVFTDKNIRAFSHQLYPAILEVSLDLALSDLLAGRAKFELSDGLSANKYTIQNVRVLPFRTRYIVYRIIEECVANAEKKPSTKHISVDLTVKENFLQVNVTDDGGPVATPLVYGLGLRLIQDYLASLGGTFSITTFGAGARFVAQIELKPAGNTVEIK
jgi:signal transduction histidine kinase